MRSILLVILSVLFVGAGFGLYRWLQPPRALVTQRQIVSAPPLTSDPDDGSIGQMHNSDDIYIKKPDKNGNLAAEYFADEAKPRKNGQIDVKNPKANFYLNAGQVLEIIGTEGVFYENHPTKRGPGDSSGTLAPDRGRLHNVTVTLLDTTIEDLDEQPILTIMMDNASFDSENTTIVSEGFTDPISGRQVEADEVPVTVRGRDYDFDGRGMRMSWNERDRRLAKLDVAHGERLVIKHSSAFGAGPKPAAPPVAVRDSAPAGDTATVILASANLTPETAVAAIDVAAAPTTTSTTVPSTAPTTAPAPHRASPRRRRPATAPVKPTMAPPLYRATFLNNVRILGFSPQAWGAMTPAARQAAIEAVDTKYTLEELLAQHFEPLATADHMLVDFMLKNESPSSATTRPTASGVKLNAVADVNTATAPAGSKHRAVAAQATTQPVVAAAATTQPAKGPESPMYVYWTGPLHVEPYAAAALTPGESIVTLEGQPVVAHEQGSEIVAAKLTYRTLQRDMQADAAPNTLLTMTTRDAKGETIVRTPSMLYTPSKPMPGSNAAGVAVLTGASTVSMPAEGDAGGRMNSSWSKQCTLNFVSLSEGKQAIDRAEMRGDVKIDHPQMKLDSQSLDLTFASTPTTRPVARAEKGTRLASGPVTQPAPGFQTNLSSALATDAVHCVMINTAKKTTQTIDCAKLLVLNEAGPDGKFSPRTINADGEVHAVDAEQDLKAGHLAVTLMPSTRPAAKTQVAGAATTQPTGFAGAFGGNIEVQNVVAQDRVKVVNSKDGTQAMADTLLVDRNKIDGTNIVRLIGQPNAKIIDKTTTIVGPLIIIQPDGQKMVVQGNGTMHGTQQATPGATTRPIDIAWDQNMHYDGKLNTVDVSGNVTVVMSDADGALDVAKGNTAHLLLADITPATRPAPMPTVRGGASAIKPGEKPAPGVTATDLNVAATPLTPKPTTAPTPPVADATTVGHKAIQRVVFQEDAQVSSTLVDADGGLLRRLHVLAEMIQYDVTPNLIPPQKKITIPVPGRMLVEDYRPPKPQPTGAPGGNGTGNSGNGGMRGATAFKWKNSLIYDDASKLMVMDGDVLIDHRDPTQPENDMRLTGDLVTAELEAMPPLPTAPPPLPRPQGDPIIAGAPQQPATRPVNNDPRYQIKRLTAVGNLVLRAKGGIMQADTMEYDPIKHLLTARGGKRPAVFSRAVTGPGISRPMEADEIVWDTLTDLPTITKMSGRMNK